MRIRDARQNFLGIWIRCALENRPFEIWDGAQLRDLTYADDVTDAFVRAAETRTCSWARLQYRRHCAGVA